MIKFIKNLFKKKKKHHERKRWAKIEDGQDALSTYTEYTDHDGTVYKLYDLRMMPGFKEAIIKK